MVVAKKRIDYGRPSPREEARAELARRDLAAFVRQAWHVIEPATPYVHGQHIDVICEHLMAVNDGEIRNLLITMPPRHAKSTCVAVMWPTWSWIDNPHLRWMFASYALSLSIRDNRKCRQIIDSPWYQRNFGSSFTLQPDQNAKGRFENNHMGYRLAVSTDSAATGEGGDIVVGDDLHNVREAESDVQRQTVLEWWDQTMSTRLNNPKTGARVIVMQRVHQKDIAGHVLEQGGYVHLNLPAEYESGRKLYTSIGWCDWREQEGDLLWPERFGTSEIEKAKRTLGPLGYAGQYQQRPVPAGGAIFKQEWIRRYRSEGEYVTLETPGGDVHYALQDCRRIGTIDLAISQRTTADYTVIATWLITPQNDLLLWEIIRDRMDNPKQQETIKAAHARWHYESIHVEGVAYQLALVQQLLQFGVPVLPFYPVSDKVSRASTAAIFYAGGKVYHPKWAVWLEDFEQELLMFPKAAHDDCVDVDSMACALLFDGGDIPFAVTSLNAPASGIPSVPGLRVYQPQEGEMSDDAEQDLQRRQEQVGRILQQLASGKFVRRS